MKPRIVAFVLAWSSVAPSVVARSFRSQYASMDPAFEIARRDETLAKQQAALEALLAAQQQLANEQVALEAEERRMKSQLQSGVLGFLYNMSLPANATGGSTQQEKMDAVGLGGGSDDKNLRRRTAPGQEEFHLYTRVGGLAHVMLLILTAVLYRQCRQHHEPTVIEESQIRHGRWQYGLFECGDFGRDWSICLTAWCLGPIRWAETVSSPKVNYMGFWIAFFIYEVLLAFCGASFCVSGLALIIFVVISRQKIREAYGLDTGCEAVCSDVLVWSFCSCCAIAQEARQVDHVPTARHGLRNGGAKDPKQDRAGFESHNTQYNTRQ